MRLKRTYKVDPEIEDKILELRRQGLGLIEISEAVGVGSVTVQRIVNAPRQIGCLTLPPLWPL